MMGMAEVKFYENIADELLKFVVIFTFLWKSFIHEFLLIKSGGSLHLVIVYLNTII